MSAVIPKNTTIPTSGTKVFRTTEDHQDLVNIDVFQGESMGVRDNIYLGRVALTDLPGKAAGQVHVEVTFLIDADGVMNVTAREMQTGKETSVKITPSTGLSQDQVHRLTQEHRAFSN
jgi:molecular chaperone DnaK